MSIRHGALGAMFAILFTLPLSVSAAGLITNPSFETSPNSTTATGWTFEIFHATASDNDAQGTIVSGAGDAEDGTNAAQATITSYTSGAAKWVPTAVNVSQGQFYTLSFWYKSSTSTSVFLIPNGNDGNEVWQKDLPAVATYTQVNLQILVPAGWTTMQPAIELASKGSVTVDNFDLELQAAAPVFSTGLVSLSFDDSLQSFSDNATSSLNANGLTATEYVITGPDGSNVEAPGGAPNGGNMSLDELKALQSAGYEIGAHTRQHVDLVKDTPSAFGYADQASMWTGEINGSRTDLTSAGFTPVDTFAYPYGSYNAQVEAAVKSAGFVAARSVDQGFNFKTTDPYALKMQHVTNTTTAADIEAWIDQALSDKTWLILMFHEVRSPADDATVNYPTGASTGLCNDPSNPGSPDPDCTSKDVLDAVAAYLHGKPAGTVITVSAGAKLLTPTVMHTITPSSGTNGTISPNVATQVADGGSTTFTFTPAANFKVGTILIDGVATTTANSITLTNVTADHTVAVTFVDASTNPTTTLTTTATSPSNVSPIHVVATFSAPVTGFDITDVASTTNGTAGNFVAASSTVYLWDVTPTADGTVLIQVPAGVAINAASSTLSNLVSNTLTIVSSRTVPTLTLIGDAVVDTAVGQPYTDPGYTLVSPNNANVTVSTSTISTAAVDEFTETYDAVDTAGNHAARIYRTVRVSELVPVSSEQSTNVTSNSITITWTTAAPGTSRVVYDTVSHPTLTATSTNYGYANSTSEDLASTTAHSVTVSGLSAGTTYYFRSITRGSPEAVGAEISAATAGAPASSGGGGSGGGGGGGGGGPIAGSYGGGGGFYYDDQAAGHGQVLGASTSTVTTGSTGGSASSVCYQFVKPLSQGSSGADVTALQKILIADGFLKISAPTGYFGAMTKAAVSAYQKANGLDQVGLVGPKTRASLNACSGASNSNASLIAALKAQLQVLLAKLAALMAGGATSTSSTSTTTPMTTGSSTPSMTGTTSPAAMGTTTPNTTTSSSTNPTSTTTSTSTNSR